VDRIFDWEALQVTAQIFVQAHSVPIKEVISRVRSMTSTSQGHGETKIEMKNVAFLWAGL
jgi:hypothetical protein